MLLCCTFRLFLVKVREFETPGSMTPWNDDELLNTSAHPCADFKHSCWSEWRPALASGSEGKDAFVCFRWLLSPFRTPAGP